MDPFTLSTGVAGFLSLAFELVKTLTAYVSTAKSAQSDAQRLLTEIISLSQVFVQLTTFLRKPEHNSKFHNTSVLCSVVTICEAKIKILHSQFSKPGRVGNQLDWPFKKGECLDTVQTLHHCAQIIELSLTIHNGELLSQTSHQLTAAHTERKQHYDSLLGALRELPPELQQIQSALALINSTVDKTQFDLQQQKNAASLDKIREWLSPLEPHMRHHDIKSIRIKNTGEWVLDTDAYKAWLNPGSKGNLQDRTLSLYGMPGAGKTFIASTIIDYLSTKNTMHPGNCKIGVAYVYCDYRDQRNQTVLNIVGSIAYQLLELLEEQETSTILQNVNGKNLKDSEKWGECNYDTTMELLRLILRNYAETFICFDAIDELDGDIQMGFMKTVKKILEMSKTPSGNSGGSRSGVFLCFTARPHIKDTVTDVLGKEVHSVNITANFDDIRKYIVHQLDVDPRPRIMNEVLKHQLLTKIPNNSQGMFLLAALQIQVVLQELTIAKRKAAMDRLPTDLYTAFRVSLERIQTSSGPSRELGMKVLMWTHLAQRNLHVEELLHALAIEDGDTDLDEENIPLEETILNCCNGLVVIDHESSEVRLVHYSLQEFFKIHGSNYFPYGHKEIAQTCLTYLNFTPLFVHCAEQDELQRLKTSYKFLRYAATQWGNHARQQIDNSVERLALQLLRFEEVPFAVQYCFHGPFLFCKTGNEARQSSALSKCGIHLAAAFGLETIIRTLLCTRSAIDDSDQCEDPFGESMALVNSRDPYQMTPLSYAASRGHEHIVCLLLRQPHINVNSVDEDGDTPLSLATRNGHEGVVNLLLNHPDIDANAGAPLSEACSKGHENLILLFIQHPKIDLHVGTPLAAACKTGNEQLIRIFLSQADFVDPNIGTPLAEACRVEPPKNPEETVRLLLQHPKTNINARRGSNPGLGHTPLFYAAEQGHDRAVQLLIDHPNIDINARASWEDTPLSRAVERGHDKVVKLLLSHPDIDVNIPASVRYEHTSLLSAAAIAGHYSVFNLLLQHPNVDINERDIWGDTPLSWAAEKGHEGMVRELLEKPNIDVNTQNRFWEMTPLLRAVQQGHEGVVRLLLQHRDINVDTCDYRGINALAVAIDRDEKGIVELLDNYWSNISSPPLGAISRGNENRKRVFEKMEEDEVDEMDTMPDLGFESIKRVRSILELLHEDSI